MEKSFAKWLCQEQKKLEWEDDKLAQKLQITDLDYLRELKRGVSLPSLLTAARAALAFKKSLRKVLEGLYKERKEGYRRKNKSRITKVTLLILPRIVSSKGKTLKDLAKDKDLSLSFLRGCVYGYFLPSKKAQRKLSQKLDIPLEDLERAVAKVKEKLQKPKRGVNLGWRKSKEFKFRTAQMIYKTRLAQGLSQKIVAIKAGLNPVTLARLESGQRLLSIQLILAIGRVLNCDLRKLTAYYIKDIEKLHQKTQLPSLRKFRTAKIIYFYRLLRGGMPMEELAKEASLSFATFWRFEESEKLISLSNLRKLAQLLRVEIPGFVLMKLWRQDLEDFEGGKIKAKRERLQKLVAKIPFYALTLREWEVLERRYGYTQDGQSWTQQEIANFYNVSRERIRQIEKRAREKIKKWQKTKINCWS